MVVTGTIVVVSSTVVVGIVVDSISDISLVKKLVLVIVVVVESSTTAIVELTTPTVVVVGSGVVVVAVVKLVTNKVVVVNVVVVKFVRFSKSTVVMFSLGVTDTCERCNLDSCNENSSIIGSIVLELIRLLKERHTKHLLLDKNTPKKTAPAIKATVKRNMPMKNPYFAPALNCFSLPVLLPPMNRVKNDDPGLLGPPEPPPPK